MPPRRRSPWIFLAGGLFAAAYGVLRQPLHAVNAARPPISLPDLGMVPMFSLVADDGAPIRRDDLDGHVWVANFIFTRCAGQCPMMSAEMARLQTALRALPAVRFISFSVDPNHDTPEVLRDYARRYEADSARWRFVTGDSAAITQLAQQGFRLGVSPTGTAREPITHSLRFALIDKHGHLRGYYEATDPEAMQRLRAHAQTLIDHRGAP
jgi:protein SCO1/2